MAYGDYNWTPGSPYPGDLAKSFRGLSGAPAPVTANPAVAAQRNQYQVRPEEFGFGFGKHGDPFESWYNQRFLPQPLQFQQTYGGIESGIKTITDLMRNPGGLNPNVAAAIQPRLGQESQRIAEMFRNILAQQRGAAARGNLPVSIKAALESALNVSQERAQRGARAEALSESEQLRRSDTDQVYKLLNEILRFTQSGRGQTASEQAGAQAAGARSDQKEAAAIKALGAILAPFTGGASIPASQVATSAAYDSGYW